MNMYNPKPDSGQREVELAERHRSWGFNLPVSDLDNPCLDYSHEQIMGLIEYKFWNWKCDLTHPSIKALASLGELAGIPAFVVRYSGPQDDFSRWHVMPINWFAKEKYKWGIPPEGAIITEEEYIDLQYKLRGINPQNPWRRK